MEISNDAPQSDRPRQVRKQNIMKSGEMTWKLLESVLKHYNEFKALLEETGIDEITLDNGVVINYWDLLTGIENLPERQRLAVTLMCLEGLKETDAAKYMNYAKWSSPAGLYKRMGLKTLVRLYYNKKEVD